MKNQFKVRVSKVYDGDFFINALSEEDAIDKIKQKIESEWITDEMFEFDGDYEFKIELQ